MEWLLQPTLLRVCLGALHSKKNSSTTEKYLNKATCSTAQKLASLPKKCGAPQEELHQNLKQVELGEIIHHAIHYRKKNNSLPSILSLDQSLHRPTAHRRPCPIPLPPYRAQPVSLCRWRRRALLTDQNTEIIRSSRERQNALQRASDRSTESGCAARQGSSDLGDRKATSPWRNQESSRDAQLHQ